MAAARGGIHQQRQIIPPLPSSTTRRVRLYPPRLGRGWSGLVMCLKETTCRESYPQCTTDWRVIETTSCLAAVHTKPGFNQPSIQLLLKRNTKCTQHNSSNGGGFYQFLYHSNDREAGSSPNIPSHRLAGGVNHSQTGGDVWGTSLRQESNFKTVREEVIPLSDPCPSVVGDRERCKSNQSILNLTPHSLSIIELIRHCDEFTDTRTLSITHNTSIKVTSKMADQYHPRLASVCVVYTPCRRHTPSYPTTPHHQGACLCNVTLPQSLPGQTMTDWRWVWGLGTSFLPIHSIPVPVYLYTCTSNNRSKKNDTRQRHAGTRWALSGKSL